MGNLDIQEYRQLLTYERLLLIIEKPLTKIYPELHEDSNDFETIYDNKIVILVTGYRQDYFRNFLKFLFLING